MQEIVKLRSNSSNLAIHTVCKGGDDTSTTAVNTIQYIRVYEAELTKVQRAKAMYVRMLMEVEKQRLDEPASGQDEVDLSGISEEELRRLAALVEEREDGLVVHGNPERDLQGRDLALLAHGDHRMAMSLSLLECKGASVRLDNPAVVNKSFPTFWDVWKEIRG